MIKPLIALACALCSTALGTAHLPQPELDELVRQAAASRNDYIRRFRDLTAVETWVTETLRPDGTVHQRRTVTSDFFVYQSRVDNAILREYRITREVDGKAAADPVAQAKKLFRALGKALTLREEDAALGEQNFRHVLRFIQWGLTVDPVWPVHEQRQMNFQFALAGRDRVGDDDVIGLRYEANTFETRERTSIYAGFKNPRTRFRGTIWLTLKEGRLRRWVDDLLVVDDEITTAAVLMHKDISYQSSPLGVVPSRIDISLFDKVRGKRAPPSLRPTVRQTFAYDAFRRFGVSTATEMK